MADITTRARLLAILKEPGPYGAIPPYAGHNNAKWRLKRLCEEIAKVAQAEIDPRWGKGDSMNNVAEKISTGILALGEDNEHS